MAKEETKSKQHSAKDEEQEKPVARKSEASHAQTDSKPDSKQNAKSDDHDAHEESQELDQLLELLEGDVTALDPEAAIGIIDEWYDVLHKSKDEGLKGIANGLKELKKQLKSSKHPEKVAEALIQVGEQTDNAADEAERGFKTKLHKVGKALSKAGKHLEKEIESEE